MCVAIAVPEGTPFPSVDILEAAEWHNDDGIGICFPDGRGRVEFFKGLTLDELEDLGKLTEGLPRLIHFRLATSGGVVPELCHPFPITKRADVRLQGAADRVLMHNGVWGDWDVTFDLSGPLPGGPWSDTRLMARIIAIHGDSWIKRFVKSERVGRLATMDGDGNIGLAGEWERHEDGCIYSNTYFMYRSPYTWPSDGYSVGCSVPDSNGYAADAAAKVIGTADTLTEPPDDETKRYIDYLHRTTEGEPVMTPSEYQEWWARQGRSTRQERLSGEVEANPLLPEELR